MHEQWPAHRQALLAAVPGQRVWRQAVDTVQSRLKEAKGLVARGQWQPSHEVLEDVRQALYSARRALGVEYALDSFTEFHSAMEKLATATTVQRSPMEVDFATARALWRRIEVQSFDPGVYGLSAPQLDQLNRARADESRAIGRLSQALRSGSDAEVLVAAGAIKGPFVRAYLAFGSPL